VTATSPETSSEGTPGEARYRAWGWHLVYLIVSLVAGATVWRLAPLQRLEWHSYDRSVAAAAPGRRDSRIVLVTIDDESFKQIKRLKDTKARRRWPWPSSFFARAIDRLFDGGAAVVALDLLTFDTPSAPLYAAEDQALIDTCAKHPGQVVVAQRYDLQVANGLTREEWFQPIKPLRKVVRRGYVNALRDPDGVIRRVHPLRKRLEIFPERSFAVAIAEAYLSHQTGNAVTAEAKHGALHLANQSIPLDDQGRALIAMTATGVVPDRTISFWHLLTDENVDPALLKDAIVLLGPTTVDLHDRHPTPMTVRSGEPVDGIAVQADQVHALLHGSKLHPASPGTNLFLACLTGLLGLLVATQGGALWGPLLLLLFAAGYWWGAGVVLATQGLWVEVARPLAVMLAIYLVVTALRLAGEERQRREVRKMFSAYVSGEVLQYLEEHPGAFSLTGERRDVTVFFSDVQGFTDMSETVTPEVLAGILNRYFTPMSELVMEEGGYVDKYIGDCIMAVFGVPKPLENHALRCCRSALRQIEAMKELNKELEADFGKTLNFRIGINSGMVSAGNMGSDSRFEYTVMGDVVNLGSRLEGANKGYGTRIMVGASTYEATQEDFEFRLLDLLRVKGKLEPVKVYELLGAKGEVSEAKRNAVRTFEEAWELHRERRWDEAEAGFHKTLELAPEDGPAKLYLSRIESYRHTPPPEDWGGVFVMTTK
jgi:adenylate cyclase